MISRSNSASASVRELPPVGKRGIPDFTLWRIGSAGEIVEHGVVGRYQSEPRAEFDRHVADGEAAFHRQSADSAAGIFDRIAIAGGDADFADQMQDDVLADHARRQRTIEIDAHRLRLFLHAGLGREDVREFARADAP